MDKIGKWDVREGKGWLRLGIERLRKGCRIGMFRIFIVFD